MVSALAQNRKRRLKTKTAIRTILAEKASKILKLPEFTVTIDLGLGEGKSYYYTSDLTYDYVRINAAYRT